MTDSQRFQLWLVAAQAVLGTLTTVVAVYIAAASAFRTNRKQSIEARSREAAEKLLRALWQSDLEIARIRTYALGNAYMREDGILNYNRITGRSEDIVNNSAQHLSDLLASMALDYTALSNEKLRQHLEWSFACLSSFQSGVGLTFSMHDPVWLEDLATSAHRTGECISKVMESLNRYIFGKPLPGIPESDAFAKSTRDTEPWYRNPTIATGLSELRNASLRLRKA